MAVYEFLSPQTIAYGKGSLKTSGERIKELGKKAFVVTDKMINELGYTSEIIKILKEQEIDYYVFAEIDDETTDLIVKKGTNIFKEEGCEFLISLGGGSTIDAAKAIGVLSTNSGEIVDYAGENKVKNKIPYHVAIPTTAGSGSEVTKFAVITSTLDDNKKCIDSPYILPQMAIVDYTFTLSLPKDLTASTGVDALSHAIEAYTSTKNQPISDHYALSAIKRISHNLKAAWIDGDDEKARQEMLLGSLESGMALSNSSLTMVHGLNRPLRETFHIPHSISIALLLPECMECLIKSSPERFAKVALAMGVYRGNEISDLLLSEKGLKKVKNLCKELKIPSLTELGVDRDIFLSYTSDMAQDALEKETPFNTFIEPTKDELIEIYENILE